MFGRIPAPWTNPLYKRLPLNIPDARPHTLNACELYHSLIIFEAHVKHRPLWNEKVATKFTSQRPHFWQGYLPIPFSWNLIALSSLQGTSSCREKGTYANKKPNTHGINP